MTKGGNNWGKKVGKKGGNLGGKKSETRSNKGRRIEQRKD
jgi:hypothetical protein